MDNQQLIALLLAMRAQVEAMHAQIQGVLLSLGLAEAEEATDQGCRHSENRRVYTSAMGSDRRSFLCLDCNTNVTQ